VAEEKKKKTLTEQLNDPVFEALGGLNIFDMPVSPSDALKRIQEAEEKEKENKEIEDALKLAPDNINLQSEKEKRNIIDEAEGNNEVSLDESVSNAIVSGGIKIPYG